MKLTNTTHRFGWLSMLLHWVMAIAIIGLFGLGIYMMDLGYYDPWYQTAPNIHRSVGILVALALLLRWVWRLSNIHPLVEGKPWEQIVARTVHRAFYMLMFAVLLSGYLISTADGREIAVFDWFEVPATLHGYANQEDIAGKFHKYLAYGLMGLVVLHTLAALKHHFIDRDATLRRMLGLAREN
jgi:cytochrome b561